MSGQTVTEVLYRASSESRDVAGSISPTTPTDLSRSSGYDSETSSITTGVNAFADVDTETKTSRKKASLLTLPLELRRQIYAHLLDPPPTLTLQTSTLLNTKIGVLETSRLTSTCISTSKRRSAVHNAIIYTCHQLHDETLPLIQTALRLEITSTQSFDHHSSYARRMEVEPGPADVHSHVPARVLRDVRFVMYKFPLPINHAAAASGYSNQSQARPSREAFPFALTPRLKRFVVRKAFKMHMDMLRGEDKAGLSRVEYEGLEKEAKMRCWDRTGLLDARPILGTVGRFGSGGWVSRLVVPDVYGGDYAAEVEGGAEPKEGSCKDDDEKQAYLDPSGLGVPSCCDVVVEADISLFAGQSWRPVYVETVIVEVGVAEKKVRRVRFEKQ